MRLRGGIILIGSLCAATAGYAVTIPVNTTLMTVANDGTCSLPEAIIAANTNTSSGAAVGECPAGSGADSIVLQVGATYTMTTGPFGSANGADALPPITTVIEILGNGARLERSLMAATLFRLIEVSASGTLTLADLTIADGHTGPDNLDNGYDGGCIFSKGHLVVTGSLVTGCHAGDGSQNGGNGGAIFATGGSLSVIGSTIELSAAGETMNHSGGSGGAIAAVGIAVTIQDTTVYGNDAGGSTFGFGGDGGGISIEDGMLTLLRSTVHFNDAGSSPDEFGGPGSGGGISAETADVSIDSSSINSNGAGTNPFRSGNGGGLYMTGSGNSLRIAGSSIVSNASGAGVSSSTLAFGKHAGLGGGLFIYNVTDVAILGSQLRANLGSSGGGFGGSGGSAGDGGSGAAMWIQSVSTVQIAGSLIEQNTNGNGGAAFPGSYAGYGGHGPVSFLSVGTVTIEDTMLRANSSGNGGDAFGAGGTGGNGGSGGALDADSSNVSISRSSIVDNHAGDGGDGNSAGRGGNGGGLSFSSGGEIEIVNTTVSGNGSGDGGTNGGSGGSGGGISANALLVLTNCTLSNNGAGSGSGGGLNGNGGNLHALVNTTITNSVLANNQFGGDCFNQGSMNNLNLGNNIVEDNSCGFTGGSDPRLAALGFYGGPTLSHALCTAAGVPDGTCVGPSPAIDAGADATCSDMFVKGIDQRVALRNAGVHCDIGAFESNGTAAIAMTGDAAAFPGGFACIGVSAAPGYPLETLTAQIDFNDAELDLLDAFINPLIGPSTASDKQLSRLSISGSSDLFTVYGGNGSVPAGAAFTALFEASLGAFGTYPITPLSSGNLVVTTCSGDCNGNGSVTLEEVQRCAGRFLGRPLCNLQEPGLSCTMVDSNLDGTTSIGELQRCASHFIGSCP